MIVTEKLKYDIVAKIVGVTVDIDLREVVEGFSFDKDIMRR